MKRIYLAGPDVFEPNPTWVGEQLKDLCRCYGFEGAFPLDGQVDLNYGTPRAKAMRIFGADIGLLESCDIVIANLTPFRGPSADVGTAVEVGWAAARGKLVFAYDTRARTYDYKNRLMAADDGKQIENFGLTDNLMLHGCLALPVFTSFEDALVAVKFYLENVETAKKAA